MDFVGNKKWEIGELNSSKIFIECPKPRVDNNREESQERAPKPSI